MRGIYAGKRPYVCFKHGKVLTTDQIAVDTKQRLQGQFLGQFSGPQGQVGCVEGSLPEFPIVGRAVFLVDPFY